MHIVEATHFCVLCELLSRVNSLHPPFPICYPLTDWEGIGAELPA